MSDKLKPLFLVKPQSISQKEVRRAERLCGICIVECSEPDVARYSEPPLEADLDSQARAALELLRMILRSPVPDFKRSDLLKWFVDQLLTGQKPVEVPRVKKS